MSHLHCHPPIILGTPPRNTVVTMFCEQLRLAGRLLRKLRWLALRGQPLRERGVLLTGSGDPFASGELPRFPLRLRTLTSYETEPTGRGVSTCGGQRARTPWRGTD